MKDEVMNNDSQPDKRPSLTVDWRAYASMLEESDLSEESKRELILTLWNIVVSFVDLGFAAYSAPENCGESVFNPHTHSRDMLGLDTHPDCEPDASIGVAVEDFSNAKKTRRQ